MSKLYVIGNCYAETSDNAEAIFSLLEGAGYTLAFNTRNKNSATILKEMEEPVEPEE